MTGYVVVGWQPGLAVCSGRQAIIILGADQRCSGFTARDYHNFLPLLCYDLVSKLPNVSEPAAALLYSRAAQEKRTLCVSTIHHKPLHGALIMRTLSLGAGGGERRPRCTLPTSCWGIVQQSVMHYLTHYRYFDETEKVVTKRPLIDRWVAYCQLRDTLYYALCDEET